MSEKMTDILLTDNKELRQFETRIDGLTAWIEYNIMDDRVFLTHAEVPEQFDDSGLGAALVQKALEEIGRNNLKVVPACAFVKSYIRQNSKYRKLLAPGIIIE
ncbi:MAG: N-acetyltransferase [Bacteroidales bacterium]|nr:N-acetyltransferase [Bacteroidales bacterium]